MTSAGPDIVHGAQIPSPRWWRRFRNVPLIALAVLSLLAAVVGWVAQYRIAQISGAPAPVASSPAGSSVSACAPGIGLPDSEPWIDGDGSAERVWESHAAELAGAVVSGRDGWAFYNDQIEENFSQAVGRRHLSVAEVEAWIDYFSPLAESLDSQGIELSIQVAPSATSVYPEQLPAWTDGLVGSTPLDQFLAAADALPVVDFRHALRMESSAEAVFTPVNSHWTDWGGYVAWQMYTDCHAITEPDSEPLWVPEVHGVESDGIFNEYAGYGIADATPEWTAPVFTEPLADVEVTAGDGSVRVLSGDAQIDLGMLPASTVNESATSSRTALILRDSMGNALTPYWGQNFAQTWQIQHRYDDWSNPPDFAALVAQYQPDVVIVEFAERHLVNAPAVGVTTGY